MQKLRLEIPYRFEKSSKKNTLSFLKVKILTTYGFGIYRSYTDFDIKLDGFIRILA